MRMLRLAAVMGLSLLVAGPAMAQRKATLVIGLDISDGRNYDTARSSDLTPPLTFGAVYDTLVTLAPDDRSSTPRKSPSSASTASSSARWRAVARWRSIS